MSVKFMSFIFQNLFKVPNCKCNVFHFQKFISSIESCLTQYADLIQRLEEKENTIVNLQSENRTLAQEKYGLMTRLESTRDIPEAAELGTKCANALCKRKERESELTKHDLSRLEEENDDLKRRVQALTEKAASDQERIKNAFQELEDHIRKLEDERKELVQGQTSRRTTITRLEEEQDMLREQLRIAQSELIGQKANYNQLKNLHDQTDRALSDTRAQLLQAETELANFQQKMRSTGSQSVLYEKQISALQNDIQIMKGHLNKIEHEKDELLVTVDEKTEKIAMLEEQIKSKSNTISNLQGELAELRRKVGKYGDDSRSQDEILRTTKRELENLRLELENERKNKEAATKENKRLMDDVSSLTCDCKESRKELDLAHRQIEDLKRQLQHYVAEVKRFEDLMDKKELERNELLDQFKSLSQEANILENNNHTLENEASQSRVQLNVALDHASELERKLENQDSIIRSYERQISELTSQVASLEIQLKQCSGQQERFESELKCTRDLCVKLDQDKDNFRRELMNRDEYRAQLDRNLERLRADNEALKSSLSKDRNNVEGLEKLLNDARQEAIDQRLLNQELQAEVNKLKTKVEELQDRLRKIDPSFLFHPNTPPRNMCDRSRCPKLKSPSTPLTEKVEFKESPVPPSLLAGDNRENVDTRTGSVSDKYVKESDVEDNEMDTKKKGGLREPGNAYSAKKRRKSDQNLQTPDETADDGKDDMVRNVCPHVCPTVRDRRIPCSALQETETPNMPDNRKSSQEPKRNSTILRVESVTKRSSVPTSSQNGHQPPASTTTDSSSKRKLYNCAKQQNKPTNKTNTSNKKDKSPQAIVNEGVQETKGPSDPREGASINSRHETRRNSGEDIKETRGTPIISREETKRTPIDAKEGVEETRRSLVNSREDDGRSTVDGRDQVEETRKGSRRVEDSRRTPVGSRQQIEETRRMSPETGDPRTNEVTVPNYRRSSPRSSMCAANQVCGICGLPRDKCTCPSTMNVNKEENWYKIDTNTASFKNPTPCNVCPVTTLSAMRTDNYRIEGHSSILTTTPLVEEILNMGETEEVRKFRKNEVVFSDSPQSQTSSSRSGSGQWTMHKNSFTVEGPDIECCVANYKVVQCQKCCNSEKKKDK